jgi:hypothetical protein
MTRVVLLSLLLGFLGAPALGQTPSWKQEAKQLARLPDLVSNDVQVLAPAGDSLWSGPFLTLFLAPEDRENPADSLLTVDRQELVEGQSVVFSIEAENTASGGRVWAGLAFDTGGGEPGVAGYLVSSNGGTSFERRGPQLDAPSDTTIAYGNASLPAVPVTQQASSTPQDLAFGPGPDTVWVAGVRSGLRWSVDGGQSWARAVLPPDTSRSVDPAASPEFLVSPPLGDGRGWRNHLAYSVHVDHSGTVWAGTLGGLNWSRPADRTTIGGTAYRGWQRVTSADSTSGPPGNFVVSIAEQPRPGARNRIWVAAWPGQQQADASLQRFGVAVTNDGGTTFRQTLIGERIFDLAARQSRVYAVGQSGLFVSVDQGRTWRSVGRFPLRDDEQVLPSSLTYRSVAVTTNALWVGTSEGLLRLARVDEPALLSENPEWTLLRAQTPVNPEAPSETVPDVSTYAYPNPFVPSQDEFVRIAYELNEPGTVEINIYDFAMNRVRTLTDQKPAGQHETVWRGTDEQGLRVPTGAYIYTVEAGGRTVDGKILVTN